MRNLKVFSIFLLFSSILIPKAAQAATDWTPPTPEELSMTAEPAAPGAVAIILYQEEASDNRNSNNTVEIYKRIKILAEAGKEYGNISIDYPGGMATIDNFEGRTIHSDGTIFPFLGKGLDQIEEKSGGRAIRKKVFAMPDVQVRSILEFRYEINYTDSAVVAPSWYIQSELYTRKAHYSFVPFVDKGEGSNFIVDKSGQRLSRVAYTSVLPPGVDLKKVGSLQVDRTLDVIHDNWVLDVTDISPIPKASFLPPIHGLSYRLQFFYTANGSADEFWNKDGKVWSKDVNQFANPGSQVKEAVAKISAGSEDQKLRTIYAAVMQLKNTQYVHSGDVAASDQKSPAKNSDDIWTRKRGNPQQITRLFVAMARAAGMKAYVMDVTNRDQNIFSSSYLNFDQLDGEIAIVEVDGKDQFFDPGSLYCPYGQLEWKHTLTGGIRQIGYTKNSISKKVFGGIAGVDVQDQTVSYGTVLATTPSMSYKDNVRQRVAMLALAQDGSVSGQVQLVYLGQPALSLRQGEADTDLAGATKNFEAALKDMLPTGMTAQLTNISSLQDGEKPLILDFMVHGSAATVTSRHVLLPSQMFAANHKQLFSSDTRKYPVYFPYPQVVFDQVNVTLPDGMRVDDLPKDQSVEDSGVAVYRANAQLAGKKLTFHRMFALASIYIEAKDYPKLHDFYSQVNADDATPAILASGK